MATTPLEQKFGILANATLTDKMPGLEEDSLGFQIVQTEEDDSRAFGVQVYNIGKHLVLVPMFFLDGKVKGGEVMYVKDLNKFLPLTEVEVNNLESGKTFSMGEPSDEVDKNKGTAYRTSTMELNWLNSKRAGEVGLFDADDIYNMLEAAGRIDFPKLKDVSMFGPKAAADLAEGIVSIPRLANALLAVHTPAEIKEALDPGLKAGETIQKIAGMKGNGRLSFVEDPFSKEAADLSDEQKQLLMRNGIVALDSRKEASVALKERKAVHRYGTPSSNGKYDVVMRDGSTVKADIVFCGSSSQDCCDLCCDGGENPRPIGVGSTFRYASRIGKVMLFTDKFISTEPATDVCVDLQNVEDTSIGDKVTASALTSRVVKKGERSWGENKSYPRNRVLIYDNKHDVSYDGYIEADNKEVVLNPYGSGAPMRIVLTGKPGTMFTKGGILYIPDSAKIIALEDYESRNSIGCRPADIASEALVNGGLETVKVASDGRSWRIDDSNGGTELSGYAASLKYLMKDIGLREKQANDILDAAKGQARNGQLGEPVSFWCKCAFADPADDPWFGVGDDHFLTLEAGRLGGPLDSAAVGKIEKASRTGVKEIIDTQIMGELAKSAYSVDKVQDYLPALMKALDRICRSLVLFYWHNEDFEERYGKQNMPQLEDALKDNIRSLGDLVNYLRDKSVQDEEGTDDDETDDLSQEMA